MIALLEETCMNGESCSGKRCPERLLTRKTSMRKCEQYSFAPDRYRIYKDSPSMSRFEGSASANSEDILSQNQQ